jgi:hypothetical protein
LSENPENELLETHAHTNPIPPKHVQSNGAVVSFSYQVKLVRLINSNLFGFSSLCNLKNIIPTKAQKQNKIYKIFKPNKKAEWNFRKFSEIC